MFCCMDPRLESFAEFRQGTVLEEEAETGHNVALKNTVLTAGVVAGSLINFCDVLLTGGSSRNDHSEVGSGSVHFNFDPRGDKFGSLMGDTTGCLLRSRRIFVGGNSGVVAPVHLAFGVVVAAGSIVRKDVAANQLSAGDIRGRGGLRSRPVFRPQHEVLYHCQAGGKPARLARVVPKVRLPHSESGDKPLYFAADGELNRHIRHRVNELAKVIGKLERSLSKSCKSSQDRSFCEQHRMLLENKDRIISFLVREEYAGSPGRSCRGIFESLRNSRSHTDSVRSLTQESSQIAMEFLRGIAAKPYLEMRAPVRCAAD